MAHSQYFERHLGRRILSKLAARGVVPVGTQWIPAADGPMPVANGQAGYVVDDNGCGRVLTHAEILELAS